MFVKLEHFIQEWENETKATRRVLETLTDASLAQEVVPGHRTLGRMAWHIAMTINEMMSRTGLDFPSFGEHEEVPGSAEAIVEAYVNSSRAFIEALKKQWTDASLTQTCNLYGEEWPNAVTLRVLIQHEVHHRGQLTVLMRQAGLRVPGVYGPAQEEWANMGMPAPTV